MKLRNSKIGEVKNGELNDARIVNKLDESGFIDRAFASPGATLK